jgi:hypothetical protein
LSSILALSERLESARVPDPDKLTQYHRIIGQEARRLSTLVTRLLDFAQIEEGRKVYALERVELVGIVRDAIESFEHSVRPGRIRLDGEEAEPLWIPADRTAVSHCIQNLIENAVKYSPPDSPIVVTCASAGDFAIVDVRDHGIPVVTNESSIDDDDTRVGFVLGAIYQPARAVSFGVSYARRPSFEMTEDFRLNTGRQRGNNGPFASQIGFPKTVTLNLPDQASAGVALRPHSRLLVALDGAYVRHSELARNLTPVIGFDLVTASDFKIDDVLELHLGAELNLGSDSRPLFVRAGVFSNPDHRLQYVGNVQPGAVITAAQAQRINVIERSVFNLGTGGTEVKGTIGGGLTLGRHGQVDVAYVWNRRFVVSLGGRF